MGKKHLTFLSAVILLALALIVSGASCKRKTISEQEKSAGLANPASVKCEQDGGEIINVYTPQGTKGICLFKNNSVCNQWDYFDGECKRGDCYRRCREIGAESEGWYNSCDNSLIKEIDCALNEPYKSTEHDFQVYFPTVIDKYEVKHEVDQEVYSYHFTEPADDSDFADKEQANFFTVKVYDSAQWQKLDSSQQVGQEKLVEMNNKVYAIEFYKDVPEEWQDKWNKEAMNVVKDNFGLVFE